MTLLASMVMILGFGFWILQPLFREESFGAGEYAGVGELKDLYALKEVAYDTLRDIEFDFRMGKMAENDYKELQNRYRGEAAEIVGQIETLEERFESEAKKSTGHRHPGKS